MNQTNNSNFNINFQKLEEDYDLDFLLESSILKRSKQLLESTDSEKTSSQEDVNSTETSEVIDDTSALKNSNQEIVNLNDSNIEIIDLTKEPIYLISDDETKKKPEITALLQLTNSNNAPISKETQQINHLDNVNTVPLIDFSKPPVYYVKEENYYFGKFQQKNFPLNNNAYEIIDLKDAVFVLTEPNGYKIEDFDSLEGIDSNKKPIYIFKESNKKPIVTEINNESDVTVEETHSNIAATTSTNNNNNQTTPKNATPKHQNVISLKNKTINRNLIKKITRKIQNISATSINLSVFQRLCYDCKKPIKPEEENFLKWETMEFCDIICLTQCIQTIAIKCITCGEHIEFTKLAKFSVRFGQDLVQFCGEICYNKFLKTYKICTFCQKSVLSNNTYVDPSAKNKEFCSKLCHNKYFDHYKLSAKLKQCYICDEYKYGKNILNLRAKKFVLCDDICYDVFKYIEHIKLLKCDNCFEYYEKPCPTMFALFLDKVTIFCSKICYLYYLIFTRKVIPCVWCNVKKFDYDLINKIFNDKTRVYVCSLNCLNEYSKHDSTKCGYCKKSLKISCKYFAEGRFFCSKTCYTNYSVPLNCDNLKTVTSNEPVPTSSNEINDSETSKENNSFGLASVSFNLNSSTSLLPQYQSIISFIQKTYNNASQPIIIQNSLNETKNVAILITPKSNDTNSQQTEKEINEKDKNLAVFVTFSIPPESASLIVPIGVSIPINTSVLIPNSQNASPETFNNFKTIDSSSNSLAGWEIKTRINVETEKDVFVIDNLETDTNLILNEDETSQNEVSSNEEASSQTSNEENDTSLQETDFETLLTMYTLKNSMKLRNNPQIIPLNNSNLKSNRNKEQYTHIAKKLYQFNSKRIPLGKYTQNPKLSPPPKKRKLSNSPNETTKRVKTSNNESQIIENYNSNNENSYEEYLQTDLTIKVWNQYIIEHNNVFKNVEKSILLKENILDMTRMELNYALCLFVHEVRKKNGTTYCPDTIYYLCLGIQQYLFNNKRTDNIFFDADFEVFIHCLNDIAKTFLLIFIDRPYIVSRVDEEHLWESKQLGIHSPFSVLQSVIYFTTKYYAISTVNEHLQISFSHIKKYWKSTQYKKLNVLRFYPPRTKKIFKSHKKLYYDLPSNDNNISRCPLTIFDFYLSKCPVGVKNDENYFYLTPENSYVADSPIWFSNNLLTGEVLEKILNRFKLVTEINYALLTVNNNLDRKN